MEATLRCNDPNRIEATIQKPFKIASNGCVKINPAWFRAKYEVVNRSGKPLRYVAEGLSGARTKPVT